jgi:hypothetical protein
LQEKPEDLPDDLCFLRIHNQLPVRPSVIAKESAKGNGDLSVCEPLSLSPGAVL